jgi:penicillin-insensitive murein endopeptidase
MPRVLYALSALLALAWAGPARAAADCKFPAPVELQGRGDHWHIPTTWAKRGLNYGTASMVGLIQRAAQRVAKARPGAILYVGDISRRKGGASEWHKSHRCGCDADLLFFAVDDRGKPIPPPREMIRFDARGVGRVDGRTVHFDTARNWALVKALLQDKVRVERLFIHAALRRRLLAYAKRRKEDAALIARASDRMLQPTAAGPHDDHLHVRITPSAKDLVPARPVQAAPPAKLRVARVTPRRPATRRPEPRARRPVDECDVRR